MPILTDLDFYNAKRDIKDIGDSVNTEAVIRPRWGKPYKSIPLVSKEGWSKITELNAAIAQAAAAGAGANGWTDQLVLTYTGGLQVDENKAFVTSVDDYSELGGIYANLGRAVLVKNEGISGVFVYTATIKTADGVSVITDSQGRTWERKDFLLHNASWYGVVGDGVTNNDTQFSKVIDYATLESGDYLVSQAPSAYLSSPSASAKVLLDGNEYILDGNPTVISPYLQTEVDGYNVRYSNIRLGISAGSKVPNSSSSYANTFVGEFAGGRISTPITRVTAVGTHSARDAINAYSVDAFGTNALKWGQYYDRVLSFGANSCINLGSTQTKASQVNGIYNGATVLASRFDARYPAWRDKYWVGNLPAQTVSMRSSDYNSKATHVVAVGRNALGFSLTATNCVAVGYDAMTCGIDANNSVAVGDRAMQYTVDVLNTVGIGASVMANTSKAHQTIAMGVLALSNYTISEQNVAIGYQALRGSTSLSNGVTASGNVVIGRIAAANATALSNSVILGNTSLSGEGASGEGIVSIGYRSTGSLTGTGNTGNTAIGKDAARYLMSGSYNTAIGSESLITMIDGTNPTNLQYGTGIGWGAKVSGSRQLQLGSPAVTTYAYGAIQDRSDIRDKADITDTPDLMTDFVLNLRPVQGVWDMRDDYISSLPKNWTDEQKQEWWSNPKKDGSKKRNRKHNWFIAQEVKDLADKLGVDFAGLQDHKLIDGTDTYTIGYEEFIPPIVATIQKLNKRLDAIESRLSKLE